MKYTITPLLLLFGMTINAQEFYDINTIQNIEITFAESNWDQLLDQQKQGNEDYILAQKVTINGIVFDSVGVKYKGNSTYSANQTKNPFHIELNTYKDQDFQGYTDIKLSNVAKDPSFLREVLSYKVLRNYMDAPLSNYANVYVNGTHLGLYTNSEAINKRFVNSRFLSKKNTFLKCNPPAGAGPQSNDLPNLVYLGTDSTDYYDAYELKSDSGWDELIHLCDTLKNKLGNIEEILDVDRTLWMLAYDNALVNLDSYIGGFAQNYYLYRNDFGRFVPVVWDLNESFGRFSQTGSGNLNNTASKQQMSPFLHENDSDFPLIQQLLSIPRFKRMYLAHFKTILTESFESGSYYDDGLSYQEIIKSAVQADNNKFFTYNNFIDNLVSDVNSGGGPGGGATPGITNLMEGRTSYLLGLSQFTSEEPIISQIEISNPLPQEDEFISLSVKILNANSAYLAIRNEEEAPFNKLELFDDGLHNDGAANDQIYGVDFSVGAAFMQYYIYAENDEIGMFSPRRAEHEFYSLTATTTSTTPGVLVINEFMASNSTTEADQDGEFDDWIELYNNGDDEIDLEGYSLSDDADDLQKWSFPEGSKLPSHTYLIVWADNDEEQEGLHAGFKLSAAAESIFLVNPEGEVLDEVSYVDQNTDISFGRFPNGTGNFQIMSPTFNSENNDGLNAIESPYYTFDISVYPNPAQNMVSVAFGNSSSDEQEVSIYNSNGVRIISQLAVKNVEFDLSKISKGLYFIRIQNTWEKLIIY